MHLKQGAGNFNIIRGRNVKIINTDIARSTVGKVQKGRAEVWSP